MGWASDPLQTPNRIITRALCPCPPAFLPSSALTPAPDALRGARPAAPRSPATLGKDWMTGGSADSFFSPCDSPVHSCPTLCCC